MTLASLQRGQKGVIRAIHTRDPMVQRLMVLGLVEGAEVKFCSSQPLLGCVGLLLKKAWCVPLFLVSLLAIIVQFSHWLFMTAAIEVYGSETYMMPLLVTAIAALLVWYSRGAKSKGWLQ